LSGSKDKACGKKFSKGLARKLKTSEIFFVCRGAGKTKALGHQASEAKIYIKKPVKKNQPPRCLDFTGISFISVQEDLETFSDWSEWSFCKNDQISRTRSCTGIFCEAPTETEALYQMCQTTTTKTTTTSTTTATTTTTTTGTTTSTTTKMPCDPGFELSLDETECLNIDECALNMCPENSSCLDTIGSFECECFDGYFGDDKNFCITPRSCHVGSEDCVCEVNFTNFFFIYEAQFMLTITIF
jgi:hypothetical protein